MTGSPGRWTLGRVIALTFALSLLGAAGYCLRGYLRLIDRNNAAEVAEPLRMQVDFSRPGVYEGILRQDFSHTCKQQFRLEGDVAGSTEEQMEKMLKGLRGRIAITRSDGQTVLNASLDETTLFNLLDTAGAMTWHTGIRISPPNRGEYRVTLTIHAGAPALLNQRQFLVSRYELCGLESLQANVRAIIGGTFLLFSIIPAVLAFRDRNRAATQNESVP